MKRATITCFFVLTLVACGPLRREHRYIGTITDCGINGHSTLTYIPVAHGEGRFAFAPGDGSLIIRGTVTHDGTISGSLNTQAPGKTPFILSVSGRIQKDVADVTYATATCQTQGHLRLVPITLLP